MEGVPNVLSMESRMENLLQRMDTLLRGLEYRAQNGGAEEGADRASGEAGSSLPYSNEIQEE